MPKEKIINQYFYNSFYSKYLTAIWLSFLVDKLAAYSSEKESTISQTKLIGFDGMSMYLGLFHIHWTFTFFCVAISEEGFFSLYSYLY